MACARAVSRLFADAIYPGRQRDSQNAKLSGSIAAVMRVNVGSVHQRR